MKFIVVLAVAMFVAVSAIENTSFDADMELIRTRKSAAPSYTSSYSAPPCPKNYLFSCQPHLQPVPCSASSYGSAGAYSQYAPTYAIPQHFYPQQQTY